MTDLDTFLPDIMQYAPGCAVPTAHFWLRKAAIAFCERVRVWRYDDEIPLSADGCDEVIAPYGAVVHQIESCSFNGQPLSPKSPSWLDDNLNGWRDGNMTGMPRYVTQLTPNTLHVVPRQQGTLRVNLWLKPAEDADELPDFMASQYRETIAHGALARILMLPNQSFSNAEFGAAFGAAFSQKLDSLSVKGSTGQQRAPLRTRASSF
jgi:hypothetical protein